MKNIVLIEDNADIRESTKEILELADYKVFVAENGIQGVELVKSKKPDLILCDIMMPKLDGYGVLRILSHNEETSGIPFIFLSAKVELSDLRKGMNLGADDYIIKPFEEADLLEAIEVRLNKNYTIKKDFKSQIKGLNVFANESNNLGDLNSLTTNKKIRKYKKKEIIYWEDDPANFLYYISSGKVKCFKTDEYGKTFMNDIHYEGEFIGYTAVLENSRHNETAMAMENIEISLIPKQDFVSLLRNNCEVSSSFIKLLTENLSEKENRLLQLAYMPLRERIAEVIINLFKQEQAHKPMAKSLTISREDLSSIVGTAKESLNRMMSEFKKEGIIDTAGQEIKILDIKGLKKASSG